jgi:uncharacterized protein (DUF58 family)
VTLLLGFSAVNTGNNLLFLVVSALLAFMSVSGLFGWYNLHRLSVKVDLSDEIYDGTDTLVTFHLKNPKRTMPGFLLTVRFSGGKAMYPLLPRRGGDSGSVPVKFSGRGRFDLPVVEIESNFPINFFVRSKRYRIPHRFIVFPAPKSCTPVADLSEGGAREQTLARGGAEGEVRKIGDYTGSEPLKLVHWRISAKHENLKVKDIAGAGAPPLILDIESLPGADPEEALSCGTFLVNSLIRRNHAVGLRGGGIYVKPDLSRPHRLKVLTELALYGKH